MKNFSLDKIKVTDGFFKKRLDQNAKVTVKSIYHRFKETGRFDALKCVKDDKPPFVFWDSDIAKWLEATAYILSRDYDDELYCWYNQTVNDLLKNQRDDGYFNSYFQVYDPESVFKNRIDHELYNAGHFFEAGVAAAKYLNDDRLLSFSEKYADYIYDRFYIKKDTGFTTPGHQEIELALMKLYELTGKEKYYVLAKYFIDERGKKKEQEYFAEENDRIYSQSFKPVRKLDEAEGHAVRLLYLLCAMIDISALDGDKELFDAAKRLISDVINKKMYVTGATGSSHVGENFTNAYDLPNTTAYAETCASIALMFACDRMFKVDHKAVYADVLERAMYNGVFAGLSLSGDKFFYINPLEVSVEKFDYNDTLAARKEGLYIPERVKVFFCSCCPPNICRLTEQIASFAFYKDEQTLTIAQYLTCTLKDDLVDIDMISGFPYDGKVKIKINSHGKKLKIKLRVPSWSDVALENVEDGFAVYEDVFEDYTIEIDFMPKLKKIYANTEIEQNVGKVCLSYGPLILCAEGADNGSLKGISIDNIEDAILEIDKESSSVLKAVVNGFVSKSSSAIYSYDNPKTENKKITFIPYFAWGNRGKNDMKVWINNK